MIQMTFGRAEASREGAAAESAPAGSTEAAAEVRKNSRRSMGSFRNIDSDPASPIIPTAILALPIAALP